MDASGYESTSFEIVAAVVVGLAWIGAALYMIYDPETIGEATGRLGHGTIDGPTPPGIVRFAGCVLLALPVGGALWLLWWPVGLVGGLAAAAGLYHLAGRVWPL